MSPGELITHTRAWLHFGRLSQDLGLGPQQAIVRSPVLIRVPSGCNRQHFNSEWRNTVKGWLAPVKSILPGGGYAPHSHSRPDGWRLCHHQLMASKVTWAPTSSQQMEDGLGGFFGPAMEVMCTTSTRIIGQSSVKGLVSVQEIGKSSPWRGGHFLATFGGSHKSC